MEDRRAVPRKDKPGQRGSHEYYIGQYFCFYDTKSKVLCRLHTNDAIDLIPKERRWLMQWVSRSVWLREWNKMLEYQFRGTQTSTDGTSISAPSNKTRTIIELLRS